MVVKMELVAFEFGDKDESGRRPLYLTFEVPPEGSTDNCAWRIGGRHLVYANPRLDPVVRPENKNS